MAANFGAKEITVLLKANIGDLIRNFIEAGQRARDLNQDLQDNLKDRDVKVGVDVAGFVEKLALLKQQVAEVDQMFEQPVGPKQVAAFDEENLARKLQVLREQYRQIVAQTDNTGYDGRIGNLNAQITLQRGVVQSLSAAYHNLAAARGVESAEVQDELIHLSQEKTKLAELEQELRKVQNVKNNASLKGMVQDTEITFNQMISKIRQAMTIIAAMYGVVITVRWFTDINSKFEDYETQLSIAVRDTQKAKAIMAEMQSFADRTPIKTGDIIAGTQQSLAFGLTNYKKYLQEAGDWSAGTGKQLQETMGVYARVSSGQFGEAMERMKELGIGMSDLWAKGLQFDKGGQYLGTIDQFMTALSSIVNERFGGTMDKLSTKWHGLLSTSTSYLEEFFRTLTGEGFSDLEGWIKNLNDSFLAWKQNGGLQDLANSIHETISGIKKGIQEIKDAWSSSSDDQAVNAEAMKDLWVSFQDVFIEIGNAIKGFLVTWGDLMHGMGGTAATIETIAATLKVLATSIVIIASTTRALNVELASMGKIIAGMLLMGTGAGAFKGLELIKEGMQTSGKEIQKIAEDASQSLNRLWTTVQEGPKGKVAISPGMSNADIGVPGVVGSFGLESDAEVKKSREKELFDQIQAGKQQIQNEQQITNTRISIRKAFQENAVSIAKEEYDNAVHWLEKQGGLEEKAKSVQGNKYKPTQEYLEAQVKAAQAQAAYLKAMTDQADALGQFAFASEKLISEANNIAAVGGDTTVARYKAMKQALQDYTDTLDKMMQLQIKSDTANAKASALAAVAGVKKVSGDITGKNGEIIISGKTAFSFDMEQYKNQLVMIEQAEEISNVQRMQKDWETAHAITLNEQLGAEDRRKAYEKEADAFIAYRDGMNNAIVNTYNRIEGLQNKAFSAASTATNLLDKLGDTTGYNTIARTVEDVWNSTATHSLEQIERALSLKDALGKHGTSLGINISGGDVLQAFRSASQGIPDYIKQLQDGLQSMSQVAQNVGQKASELFFQPFNDQMENLRQNFQSIFSVLGGAMPSAWPQPMPATAAATTSRNVQISSPISLAMTIDGTQLTEAQLSQVVKKEFYGFAKDVKNQIVAAVEWGDNNGY